jgi:hypothetical protein
MPIKKLLLAALPILLLTGCDRFDRLLSDNTVLASNPEVEITATRTQTPFPVDPAQNNPATATPSGSPQASPTLRPSYTPWPTPTKNATFVPSIRLDPTKIPEYINPLTGQIAPNPNLLNRRPIAVKVSLFPLSALPPAGISLADHIYEYYLEYGLSRLIAIFYGVDVARVGPVRSARIFDVHIASMYNAIFVFSGAHKDPGTPRDVYGYLETYIDPKLLVDGLAFECTPYLCRDTSIDGYNNIFGDTAAISKLINQRGADNRRQDIATNAFSDNGTRSDNPARRVYIYYSSQSYSYWEFGSQKYYRFQGDSFKKERFSQLIDRYTQLPIGADNLVILFVPHEFYYRSSSTEIFNIKLTGSGEAIVFQNGQAYQTRWQRTDSNKPIAIYATDGSLFPLKPGSTFFQVMSAETKITQNGQVWIAEFAIPEIEE